MTVDPKLPTDRPVVHDTQRSAPRQAWVWVAAVGFAALVILFVAMHYLSGVK